MFDKIIKIGDKIIGDKSTFVIAEIGSNHNQDINIAYELIDVAIQSGADAVKFQSIKPETLYNIVDLKDNDKELLEKIKLKEEWYEKIIDYCKKKEILFFSAPTYLEAVDLLVNNKVKFMKIASPQTYGFPQLIKKVGETQLPVIMSTGYCKYKEIERAVEVFENTGNKKLILLHCISEYPTNYEDVNLNFIETMGTMFNVIPGFSDHTLGYEITLGAVAKGAKVIEKHITLDRNMEGPDHYFALEPDEFKNMVNGIRNIENALGNSNKNNLRPFEIDFRNELEMKLYAKQDINTGEIITSNKITYLRNKSQQGISAWEEEKILGKKIRRNKEKDVFLKYGDLS